MMILLPFRHLNENKHNEIKPGFFLNNVHLMNQDNYFRKETDPNHQMIEELNHFNWEIIESMGKTN